MINTQQEFVLSIIVIYYIPLIVMWVYIKYSLK